VIERDITLGAATVRPGDSVLVSGPIGDHGVTVMLARGELDIESDIESDTAPLAELIGVLLDATTGVRVMRDATRGGVATILNEVARASNVAIVVNEKAVPMREEVRGASEILGIDPLYVACEGRLVIIVDGAETEAALAALRSHPLGEGGRSDRYREGRPAHARAAEDRVRWDPDRRHAGGRSPAANLLGGGSPAAPSPDGAAAHDTGRRRTALHLDSGDPRLTDGPESLR